MTSEEKFIALKVGDWVTFNSDPNDRGVVTDKTDFAVYIMWDDKQMGWVDKRDLGCVEIAEEQS